MIWIYPFPSEMESVYLMVMIQNEINIWFKFANIFKIIIHFESCPLNRHSISIKMKWTQIRLGGYEILASVAKKLSILLFSLLPNL